jgi:hypothetical protein
MLLVKRLLSKGKLPKLLQMNILLLQIFFHLAMSAIWNFLFYFSKLHWTPRMLDIYFLSCIGHQDTFKY